MSQTLPGRFLVVVIVVLFLVPGTFDAVAAQVVSVGYETRLSLGDPVIFEDSIRHRARCARRLRQACRRMFHCSPLPRRRDTSASRGST